MSHVTSHQAYVESEWTAIAVAQRLSATLLGDPTLQVTGVAGVTEATLGDLVFAENEKFLSIALGSKAGVVLAPDSSTIEQVPAAKAIIFVANPRAAFVQVLEWLSPTNDQPGSIHASAIVANSAVIASSATLNPHCVVGENVRIGERVRLGNGVSIGDNCSVGDDSILHANVTIYNKVSIGQRCLIHGGVIIGADGFGFVQVGASIRKVPHLGSVSIEDDVEIGANTCVDRAKTGTTVIGAGTKIDNLVQVGHNVRVGRSCLIVAGSAIGGGAQIGDGVILAGQVGVRDNVTIGSGVKVGARAGVLTDVKAGAGISGYPAHDHGDTIREYAALTRLPEALKKIRQLDRRIAELEEHNE